jgi:hypothetical protein
MAATASIIPAVMPTVITGSVWLRQTSTNARWQRQGVILDHGAPGTFDAKWCVLPCVHRFGKLWHLLLYRQ